MTEYIYSSSVLGYKFEVLVHHLILGNLYFLHDCISYFSNYKTSYCLYPEKKKKNCFTSGDFEHDFLKVWVQKIVPLLKINTLFLKVQLVVLEKKFEHRKVIFTI